MYSTTYPTKRNTGHFSCFVRYFSQDNFLYQPLSLTDCHAKYKIRPVVLNELFHSLTSRLALL